MNPMGFLGIAVAAGLGAAALAARWHHTRDEAATEAVWHRLAEAGEQGPKLYDPAMIAFLPPVAQRYFARAIAPGTPLHRKVRLEMSGQFVMNGKALPMRACQILAPPAEGFVWQAWIGAGLMRFAGSDGYLRAGASTQSWTKFWLHGLVPLARIGGTPDHARAAATRAMLESVWVPAALLPQMGAAWTQTGPDSAEIRFAATPELPPMHVTLDPQGDLAEIWALRWSDANSDKTYRLQPFGGKVFESAGFQGFRIPVRVEMGNHWGTDAYAPFFLSRVTRAEY